MLDYVPCIGDYPTLCTLYRGLCYTMHLVWGTGEGGVVGGEGRGEQGEEPPRTVLSRIC